MVSILLNAGLSTLMILFFLIGLVVLIIGKAKISSSSTLTGTWARIYGSTLILCAWPIGSLTVEFEKWMPILREYSLYRILLALIVIRLLAIPFPKSTEAPSPEVRVRVADGSLKLTTIVSVMSGVFAVGSFYVNVYHMEQQHALDPQAGWDAFSVFLILVTLVSFITFIATLVALGSAFFRQFAKTDTSDKTIHPGT